MSTQPLWVVRAGRYDEARKFFLNEGKPVLALGFIEVPDLSTLPPEREAFRSLVTKSYPNAKPGNISATTGQLYRFVHEMKEGDFVLYPCKTDRLIYFGKVTGKYVFSPESTFRHQRSVSWIRNITRLNLSQGALYLYPA